MCDTLSTGDQTSSEQKDVFLKADASAVCNTLATCLQLSLLSCHCSICDILKKYSEIPASPITVYD